MRKIFDESFENIFSVESLLVAWQAFLPGKRGKKDVQAFGERLMDNIFALHVDLMAGIYRHGAYHEFRISDPKPRVIHKASVRDRLLHHAIHAALYPFFDRLFISDSYSCRIRKGTHKAMDRFREYGRKASRNHTRTCWVLKCDIRKFFASVDHSALMSLLEERIQDRRFLDLLANVIESFHVLPGKGIPLGNLTSQLFANIYLNELDQFMKQTLHVRYYVRYADDFVILHPDRDCLTRVLLAVDIFLRTRLDLRLHPQKVSISTFASGIDFLGWVHFPYYRVPRIKTKQRAIRRVIETSDERTLASYLGLFSHGEAHEFERDLENLFWSERTP
jgi:retron-type reverse transcriptase